MSDLGRLEFVALLGGAAASWPVAARAQQSERMQRIGVVVGFTENDPDTKARLWGFRQEMERHGWSEGRNLHIDYRFAPAGAPQALAKEMVGLQPDVIVAQATPMIAALQRETRTIPIVFVHVADPLGSGFVTSLARPSGNLTGTLLFEASITGKWLAILKEIAPGLARAGIILNPTTAPFHNFFLQGGQAVASSLGLDVALTPIGNTAAEIEQSIAAFASVPDSVLVMPPDTNTTIHRDLLIALAARHRLPAVYSDRLFVTAGGLICYSTDRIDQFRMAASYVNRILRGTKPADLPVQAPTKYQTVVNLKTAKTLGLTVPPGLLVAADEVIE